MAVGQICYHLVYVGRCNVLRFRFKKYYMVNNEQWMLHRVKYATQLEMLRDALLQNKEKW